MSNECTCLTGPNIEGPSETCPQHGREYAYWVEGCRVLQARLARVDELLYEASHAALGTDFGGFVSVDRLRAALRDEPTP